MITKYDRNLKTFHRHCCNLAVIFFSPQVKRSVIISNKQGIYQLHQELPNDLRLRKHQKNLKTSRNDSRVPSFLEKERILLKLAKNS